MLPPEMLLPPESVAESLKMRRADHAAGGSLALVTRRRRGPHRDVADGPLGAAGEILR